MNTLFNTEAYMGCLQGTFTFEFHIYDKPVAQSSFLTHLIQIIVPSMLEIDLYIYIDGWIDRIVDR